MAAQDSSSCFEHDDSGGGKRGAVVQAAVCCREHDPPPRKPADGRPRDFLLWNAQVRDGPGLGPGCALDTIFTFMRSLVVAHSACTALLTWLLLLVPSCAMPRSSTCCLAFADLILQSCRLCWGCQQLWKVSKALQKSTENAATKRTINCHEGNSGAPVTLRDVWAATCSLDPKFLLGHKDERVASALSMARSLDCSQCGSML